MKCIAWQMPDGTIRLTCPIAPPLEGESETAYLDRHAAFALAGAAKLTGKGLPGDPALLAATRLPNVDEAALPVKTGADGRLYPVFRAAWRNVAGQIRAVPALARLSILAQVRNEVKARLKKAHAYKDELDDIGTPAQKLSLAQYRQALRNLPAVVQAEIDQLTTPAQLEAYAATWPADPEPANGA